MACVHRADRRVGDWPVRHGLGDAEPTSPLAARLAARHRARLADNATLAALFIPAPSAPWALPVVLLFGTAPGWWNAASLSFVVAGMIALCLIKARTPSIATVARRAVSAR